MQFLKSPLLWFAGICLAVVTTWVTGFFNEFLPAPKRVHLAIQNSFFVSSPPSREHFRFVLTWLANDDSGDYTDMVSRALKGVDGIEVFPSAHIVEDSGNTKADRSAKMREDARKILKDWDADLAIVGSVNKVENQMHLSLKSIPRLDLVPRLEFSNLIDSNLVYVPKNAMLPSDFDEDLHVQLVATALNTVAFIANVEAKKDQILAAALESVLKKIEKLLQSSKGIEPNLYAAYGTVLTILGKRESRTERLKQAISAYEKALEVRTSELELLDWAGTQHNLGGALLALGKRENGTERLKQAISVYEKALEVRTRELEPLDWAGTQHNLGGALLALGKRENGTERLKQAISVYEKALEVRTRELEPLDWAGTQNNLGAALATLGKREKNTEHLKQAISAYEKALEVRTRERVSPPLDWAMTQHNRAAALATLAGWEKNTERLKQVISAYEKVLEVRTRENGPVNWAATQNSLGITFATLGEQESDIERLKQAISAYEKALEVRTRENGPVNWAMTQYNLGIALMILGERESDIESLKQARNAYMKALKVLKSPVELIDRIESNMKHVKSVIQKRQSQVVSP